MKANGRVLLEHVPNGLKGQTDEEAAGLVSNNIHTLHEGEPWRFVRITWSKIRRLLVYFLMYSMSHKGIASGITGATGQQGGNE